MFAIGFWREASSRSNPASEANSWPGRVSFFGLVGELRKVRHRDPEGLRDSAHGRPRRVAFTPLDQGQHVLRNPRLTGKGFQAVALLVPQFADRLAERSLRFGVLGTSGSHNSFGRVC